RAEEQIQQQHKWQPPRNGWLKCNMDTGFHNQSATTTCGRWCIRDEAGMFVRAGTTWNHGTHSIIEAEALALLESMQAATSMNMVRVIFESHAQRVVDAVHMRNGGSSEFYLTISCIKNMLALYSNFEVNFVKRQANSVAHLLAKAANSWTRCCIFI
ncbi:60S ribosomal protein l23, partial [Trifolium pratense]